MGVFLTLGNVFECLVAVLDLRHGGMDGQMDAGVKGRRHTLSDESWKMPHCLSPSFKHVVQLSAPPPVQNFLFAVKCEQRNLLGPI